MAKSKNCLMAFDAGGTMTDAFVVQEDGSFTLGKALTDKVDQSISYVDSVKDAAASLKVTSSDLHRTALSVNYTGTQMLNAILTGEGRKVGILCTRGFEDMAIMDRGLTWLGMAFQDRMHVATHEHPPALVARENVKGICGRVVGGSFWAGCHLEPGTEVIPLNEAQVRKAVEELLDARVEIIGVVFQASYANPAHERRAAEIAGEIIAKRGLTTNVETSYDISPRRGENMRFKSLLFQCYGAELTRESLTRVEDAAKGEGFKYPIQTMLAYGSAVNRHYPRLYEAVVSGPIGGLIGARYLLTEKLGIENIVAADLGGTTWDVGLVVRGHLDVKSESDFAKHRINVPVLSIDSIQGGTGIQIHVDREFKRVTLGPESAGSYVGTCYKYPDITIGDVDLVLGYLNENNFLGGKVKLDKEKALRELKKNLADPLGQDVYQAADAVLSLLHSRMADQVRDSILSKGYYPGDYTLICYGGSGPMHMWGLLEKLDVAAACTVPWAAAFSAFGVACADYSHRYSKTVSCSYPPSMTEAQKLEQAHRMNAAWKELEEKALSDFTAEGYAKEKIRLQYGIQARYIGQLDSWAAMVPVGRVNSTEDLNAVLDSFEKVYTSIYPVGARFPEAGYAITDVLLIASVDQVKPNLREYPVESPTPSPKARKGDRDVWHNGKWMKFAIWDMDSLRPGNHVAGPAIIEHPMTTFVVPPDRYVDVDRNLVLWYRKNGTS